MTGLVKCSVCGRSLIKINKDTLKCIGNCKYHNCDKNNGDGPHYFFNKKDTKYAKIHIHQAKMK